MKKKCLLFLFIVAATARLFAQTSLSEKTVQWINTSSWVSGVMPGSLSSGTITATAKTIVIDGTTIAKQNINLNTASSLVINAGDTLIVMGNMGLYTVSSLVNNGVLIVMGNFVNGASANTTSSTGKMVVTGNYTNAVGANTFTGPSYVYGTVSGFLFSPAITNESSLTATDPGLHNYVGAMYSSSLPVELLFFTARVQENETRIAWKTATEENNDHFEIERSTDGKKFDVIASVPGAGNSKQPITYQFSDVTQPQGYAYYRLKQIDYDGKTTVFNVVCVYKDVVYKLTLHPNPVVNELYLNVVGKTYTVAVNDVNGAQRIAAQEISEFNNGKFGLNVNDLEPGFYYLYVSEGQNGKKQTFTFVKN